MTFAAAPAVAASYHPPLPPPPPDARRHRYQHPSQLPELRRAVTAAGEQAGLTGERIARLAISITELATNSLEHAGGPGELRIWLESSALVCQIDDAGRVTAPLAGRIPPPADQPRGRGLLLVHQLCDLVRMQARPDGTTFRLFTYR